MGTTGIVRNGEGWSDLKFPLPFSGNQQEERSGQESCVASSKDLKQKLHPEQGLPQLLPPSHSVGECWKVDRFWTFSHPVKRLRVSLSVHNIETLVLHNHLQPKSQPISLPSNSFQTNSLVRMQSARHLRNTPNRKADAKQMHEKKTS